MKLRQWERSWGRFTPDTFLRRNKPQINHPIRQLILEEARKSGNLVLEVGCGTCISYPLYKKAGIHYTGIDITEKFIEYAKSVYKGIDARVGSILDLPFKDGSYHTSYAKSVLDHMHPQDIGKAITELARVSRVKMMVAFDYEPTSEPALIRFDTRKKFYANRYNEGEVLGLLRGVKGVKSLRIIKNIGFNKMALYIVEKA